MKTIRTFRLTPLLLCLTLLNSHALAQQKPPADAPNEPEEEVIRLDTELVQVRAVVNDSKGQPVDGLTRDDFEVFEDGKPQPISFFSISRAPGREEARALQPLVEAWRERRLVALLLRQPLREVRADEHDAGLLQQEQSLLGHA